jgi:hypothetical protein
LDSIWYIRKEEKFVKIMAGHIAGIPNVLHAEVPSEEYLELKKDNHFTKYREGTPRAS